MLKELNKFTVMSFEEGGCGGIHSIVGRKSLFKSEEDFLKYLIEEDDDMEYMVNNNDFDTEHLTIDSISEDYVRYYPKMPEGFEIESGYTFCNKGKGAFEVYVYNFN